MDRPLEIWHNFWLAAAYVSGGCLAKNSVCTALQSNMKYDGFWVVWRSEQFWTQLVQKFLSPQRLSIQKIMYFVWRMDFFQY